MHRMARYSIALLLGLTSLDALAQSAARPTLPFPGLAGEDGVHVLYTNPGLMNFDRDAGYGLYYDYSDIDGGLNSLALATTGSGLGTGIAYRQVGLDALDWWTVSSGASVRLAEALSFGSALHWQLPDGGDNNFVSWDLGVGWRPAPWLAAGGSVLNLGSPSPQFDVYTRYGGGLAVRPWGDVLTIGGDWYGVAPPDTRLESHLQLTARSRPTKGLWLRGWADVPLADPAAVSAGGAVELRFADVGVGLDTHVSAAGTIGAGGYLASIPEDDQLFLPGRGVAVFEFDEAYPYNPPSGLFAANAESYLTLLRRLHAAAGDPEVRGIVLKVGAAPFNFAQIEEIRGLVKEARDKHKPVVAYLDENGSNAAYLLATGCDRIYLHPASELALVGLSAELQFFKGTLDLVGIDAQYSKRAEFKSAPEQWTNSRSSGPAREEMNALLDDLFATLTQGIATGRGKTVDEVTKLVDEGPFTAREALDHGLVDGLIYPDELEERLHETFPNGFTLKRHYAEAPDMTGWEPQRAIAVVTVDGAISTGESSSGGLLGGKSTGSKTVVRALDQARQADSVKAVVLRVDSPGGSAFASDEIWRAVERVKEDGKPVIVSMGGYAASGGYYVASGADAIYALPSTVTGSIGVYSGKFNAQELFAKLNVETEQFNRGRNASMYSMAKPFDEVEFAALDRLTGETYRQFKDRVQAGRHLSADQVETVARGRVWSGTDAAERGLVDAFGGFFDAVDRARSEAGMRDGAPFALVAYDPSGAGDGGDLPARLIKAAVRRSVAAPPPLPGELEAFWDLRLLRDERIFAMMPYHLEIH